jgi:transglutaminase-like putative cysteine protease
MIITRAAARGVLPGRTRDDWLLYALVLGATVCLPLELQVSGWVPAGPNWLGVALGAGLLGLVLARSAQATPLAWLVGGALGAGAALLVVGRLVPPGPMIRSDLQRVWDWLYNLIVEKYRDPQLPLSYGATHLVTHADELWQRLATWASVVRSGGTSTDTSALLLAVWMGVWMLSWNAAFQLGRHRRAWAALVPLGLALLACVAYTGLGIVYARLYLGLAMLIVAWANAARMQMLWVESGVSVSAHMRSHLFLTGLPLVSLILALALLMPYGTNEGTVRFFWSRMGDRVRSFYAQLDRAFAGRNPLPKPTLVVVVTHTSQAGAPLEPAALPEHDIRGGAPTSEEIVFLVETSDPAPQPGVATPKHYWRERTYDIYTGSGWTSSDTTTAAFVADVPWKEIGDPSTVLAQTFMLRNPRGVSLAANEPVVMDGDYAVRTRGDGDLAALYTPALTYTVVSMISGATVADLRSAEQEYVGWVQERFLPLPAIPERVRQTAQRVVQRARATTRYDQAVAIEAYLRGFVYDLEIAPPPDGMDVVDYYLFQARRGYCDYSATAMVVMLRSLGVAARYASGYGQGQYDAQLGAWVVRGKNAHAWVEVYFPAYGWIEFEPTAAQSPLTRNAVRPTPQPTPTAMPTATPQPTPPEATPTPGATSVMSATTPLSGLTKGRAFPLLMGGGVLLALAGAIVVSARGTSRAPREPRQAIWLVYAQLQRQAHRLGITPQQGGTPREFLRAFAAQVEQRWGTASGVAQDIAVISQLYEQARYSAGSLTADDSARVRVAWERLRHSLPCRFPLFGPRKSA